MSPQTIDYDALAKQQGGAAVLDYDTLAAQNGGAAREVTPPSQPRTWLDSATDAAKEWWNQVNPVSAVKGITQAVEHPIDTGTAVLQNQGDVGKKAKAAFDRGDYAEGIRHFLNYLVPVLGPQIDQAGDLAQSGQYAKSAGQTLGMATNIVAPELIGDAALKLPVGQLPERLYQSALKPSTTLGAEAAGKIVDTALDNKIPVSPTGIEKLNGLISDLSDKVKSQIQAGSTAGATIDPAAVAARADQAKSRFATQVNPNADLAAVDAAKDEFLQNNPNPIPAADAQAMKQGTYTQIKNKAYGEMQSATVEAQKALARGIKEELETQFPEIKDLNAQQAKLIDLDGSLERAVARIHNHQLLGIGTPLAAGAGGMLTGSPAGAAVAGALKLILDNPEVKSKLAYSLYDAGQRGVTIDKALARVAGYSDALGHALPSAPQD